MIGETIMKRQVKWFIVAFCTGILSLFAMHSAFAATIHTVCASGCNFTSIQAANDSSAVVNGDMIVVSTTVHTEAGINLTKSLTILGLGSGDTIVQAAATPGTATNRIFIINSGITVTIQKMTIQNGTLRGGTTSDRGGAIYNLGALTLNKVVIQENLVENEHGGALYNVGVLNISNSTLANNKSTSNANDDAAQGGAIYNIGASAVLTIKNSTFKNNIASSTYNGSGTSTKVYGGAIYNTGSGDVIIANSTFNNNAITKVIAAGVAEGGAIYSTGSGSIVKISHSTVAGSSVTSGLYNTSTFTMKNSILTGYTGASGNCVNSGTFTQQGNNLVASGTDCGTTSSPNNLGALADNGGDTETIALLSGSNAIDAASSCTDIDGATIAYDQRSVPRPLGSSCDIGAFEYEDTVKVNSTFSATISSKSFTASPDTNYPAYSAYGITTLNTIFTNTHTSSVSSVYLKVSAISNGKYLLNANGGPGQINAVKFLTTSMVSNANSPVTLQLGHALAKGNFAFKVDVWGKNSVTAAESTADIFLGTIEFRIEEDRNEPHVVYLPVIGR